MMLIPFTGGFAGGDAGIAPDEIATQTLLFWVKSDTGVTTETGGRVTNWADQSGNGNDVSVGTGSSSRPTVSAAALNGYDSIVFDGSDDYLDSGTFTSLASGNIHCFWVGKQPTWTANEYCYAVNNTNNRAVRQHTSTPQIRLAGDSANVNEVSPTLDTYFLVQSGFQAATTSFQVLDDGSKSTGATEGSAVNFDRVIFGAAVSPTGFANVEFVEFVVFNSELTDATELAGLLQYFNNKYGFGW
jgi:hypothetical protein